MSGAIEAMARSMKGNRELLGNKKRLKEMYDNRSPKNFSRRKLRNKKLTKAQYEAFHTKMMMEKRNSGIKLAIVFILLMAVIFYMFYIFLF